MNLGMIEGLDLYLKALEKDTEQKAWERWLAELPVMHMIGKFKPFNEYYHAIQLTQISRRPAEEILKEAYEIRKQIGKHEG